MAHPPTDPDRLPTGPLRRPTTARWAFLTVLALALLGYLYFAQRSVGRQVDPGDIQSGRGLPPMTAPETVPAAAPATTP